ncbi:LOB domain-containing protein 42-like [Carex rostrata]
MRMSCNGCRVLRKGCSDSCVIRPCLQWIPNSEAQANATVFLAKFYGRAGLINLIAAGPEHHRPAIFRSLLYEACGRILNPVYGSVGLLWSGNWKLCQAAVESVLRGRPITAAPEAATSSVPLLKSCDIRHVAKGHDIAAELHRVSDKSRSKFKRAGASHNRSSLALPEQVGFMSCHLRCEASHESANRESDSHLSLETVVDSHVSQAEPSGKDDKNGEMGLDLTLGLVFMTQSSEDERTVTADEERSHGDESRSNTYPVELGLTVPVAV